MAGHTQPLRQRGPLHNRIRRAWRVLRGHPLIYGVVIHPDGTFAAFSDSTQDRALVEGCLIHIADPDLPEGPCKIDLANQMQVRAAQRTLNPQSVH